MYLAPYFLKKIKSFLRAIKKKNKDRVQISRDPNDDMFVSAALSYGADFVVTLDKDLLVLEQVKKVRFLKPGVFLSLLRSKK